MKNISKKIFSFFSSGQSDEKILKYLFFLSKINEIEPINYLVLFLSSTLL